MADVDVTLGLDAKQLHKELSETNSILKGFASSASSSLTGLASGFLAGFSVDKIKQAVTDAVHYGSTIQDLSDRFGVSATTLQRFGNVAEKNGASLESVAKAFRFLEVNREKALANTEGPQAKAFEGLGVSIKDLKTLKADELMLKIGHSSLNAADLVAVLGRSALDLRSTLAGLADGTEKFGGAISDLDIKRLDEMDDLFKDLSQRAKILAATIIAEVIPAVGRVQGIFAKPAEAITRAFDKTPLGEAAAPEDTALARQIHAQREAAAGRPLPDELAPPGEIKEKKKRRFDEAEGEAIAKPEKSKELDVGKADRDAKREEERAAREAEREAEREKRDSERKSEKEARDAVKEQKDQFREQQQQRKLAKADEDFAKNPTGLSLHDYATQGAGRVAALAQQAEREESIARQRQLVGDFRGATEHQDRAEQLKKALGLPNREDQKESIKQGIDDSQVLKEIAKNTSDAGANK